MSLLTRGRRETSAQGRLVGEEAVVLLAAARIAAGVGSYLLPGVAARFFGAPPARNPAVPFVVRTFGARDLIMGIGLAGSEGRERDHWLTLGVLVDTMDAAAALLAVRRRQIPAATGVAAAVTAAGAVALGLRARQG